MNGIIAIIVISCIVILMILVGIALPFISRILKNEDGTFGITTYKRGLYVSRSASFTSSGDTMIVTNVLHELQIINNETNKCEKVILTDKNYLLPAYDFPIRVIRISTNNMRSVSLLDVVNSVGHVNTEFEIKSSKNDIEYAVVKQIEKFESAGWTCISTNEIETDSIKVQPRFYKVKSFRTQAKTDTCILFFADPTSNHEVITSNVYVVDEISGTKVITVLLSNGDKLGASFAQQGDHTAKVCMFIQSLSITG